MEEIRAGFAVLCEELAGFGQRRGEKFWLYGSAVRDKLHDYSDIDVLADFDDAQMAAAIDFVENPGKIFAI